MKKLTKSDHLKIYSYMLKIRRFEERSAQLYGMGHIGGFCHLYIGQEAVVVGVLMTIKKNDSVVTTYRDHGHMIARGLDPKKNHGRINWEGRWLLCWERWFYAYVF